MPGFGAGPFGHGAFGEWAWGKNVLFFLAPENPYRVADTDGLFESYAQAQAESFDRIRRKIGAFGELRDPLLVRATDDVRLLLRLGPQISELGPIEQSGINAQVTPTGGFSTVTGRFSFSDIGKQITVERSLIAGNNRTAYVIGLVDETTVVVQPGLAVDAGPLRWTLRATLAPSEDGTWYEIADGDVSAVSEGWLLSDGFSEVEVTGRLQFPDEAVERNLFTDREGADGFFGSGGGFHAPTANFTQLDVGRRISISGSVHPENNGRFGIVEVQTADRVVLDSDLIVGGDGGPLHWAVLLRSQLRLSGSNVLHGVVEQHGVDMTISGSVLTAQSADFTSADVGKLVTIRATGSSSNGDYEITAVNSRAEVQVSPTPSPDASAFAWEVRDTTEIGDTTQVMVRPQSLLQYLATDFGVEIDTREDELFQRRWVASVPRWLALKGSVDGYVMLGALTGFDVSVIGLYRVTRPIYEDLVSLELAAPPAQYAIAVGETDAGRSGVDGSLTSVGSRIRFTSPTAAFVATDAGLDIEIQNSGSGNDGLHTVGAVIDATTVEFEFTDTSTAPDANDGALVWRVVKLYALVPPTLPVFDEINADLMTKLKGSNVFTIDKYCYETGWSTTIGDGDGVFSIVSISPGAPSPIPISYVVSAYGDANVITGVGVGRWQLTDSDGVNFFVESAPVEQLEIGAGRAGADGQLTAPDLCVSTSAVFTTADVGRQIRISDSISGNNSIFRIKARVSATTVQLDEAPLLPEGNSGSLTWAVAYWNFTVKATEPPATGSGQIRYLCSESVLQCDYCKSFRVLVRANTALVMNDPQTRLETRLDQARPAHVDFVFDFGVTATATVVFGATVTTP